MPPKIANFNIISTGAISWPFKRCGFAQKPWFFDSDRTLRSASFFPCLLSPSFVRKSSFFAAEDVSDYTLISDTMSTGPNSEIWCGSRKELNHTDLNKLQGSVFPPLSCTPQNYRLEIRLDRVSRPKMHLFNVDVSPTGYFACAWRLKIWQFLFSVY